MEEKKKSYASSAENGSHEQSSGEDENTENRDASEKEAPTVKYEDRDDQAGTDLPEVPIE